MLKTGAWYWFVICSSFNIILGDNVWNKSCADGSDVGCCADSVGNGLRDTTLFEGTLEDVDGSNEAKNDGCCADWVGTGLPDTTPSEDIPEGTELCSEVGDSDGRTIVEGLVERLSDIPTYILGYCVGEIEAAIEGFVVVDLRRT